jgi:hypothetical protein
MNETLRELDHRTSDRIDVWLLWREHDNAVLVSVADDKTGDRFTIEVREGERPLDVFHHPYAYAASGLISPWRYTDAAFHGIDVSAEPARRLEVRSNAL